MNFILLFLMFSLQIFSHSSSNYAVTESSPSALVAGAVNAITGDHYIAEVDYQIQAAVPLNLPRTYLSSRGRDTHVGWQLFYHLYAAYYKDEDDGWRTRIQLIEPNGSTLNFERSDRKRMQGHPIVFDPINLSQASGLTNVGRGKIAGKTNLKNIRVELAVNRKNFIVYDSDGTIRYYKQISSPHDSMPKELFDDDAKKWYLLQWEKLPNQTHIIYEYDSKEYLKAVRTTNHNTQKTYARADFHYHSKSREKNHNFEINTNDGKQVTYTFLTKHTDAYFLLAKVNTPAYPHEYSSYDQKIGDGGSTIGYLQTSRRLLENRHYKIEYYHAGKNKVGNWNIKLANPDPRNYRVKQLLAPVGADDKDLVTHSFFYHPEKHYTEVREIDNTLTQYFYSPQLRLEKIQRHGRNDALHNSEQLIWGEQGPVTTNLLCHTFFYDGSNNPILSKRYIYDDAGNVKEERLYGQLSGQCPISLSIGKDRLPVENGIEVYTIQRTYSQDAYRLLLSESEPNGKTTLFTYLPNTSLLCSKLICDHGQIKIRHFYEYSPDFILCREITDDGSSSDKNDFSGVKTRRIKNISLVPTGEPYQDMPKIIEDCYWDGNSEVLLKKTVLHYTTGGKVEKQDIYDATGTYCYSLMMKYDQAGRLKEMTNPLNRTASYDYDGVGNKIFSRDFSGKKAQMRYDLSNRLTRVEETGPDGLKQITEHRYDTKHNRIATIDPYGNEIRYIPNPFGQIEETHLPPISNAEGSLLHPVLYSRYDNLGREISTAVANGDTTHKSYNARHQVTYIQHPDNTTESFIYNLDGTLHSHTNQKGKTTTYTYDFLGRMTSKTDALGQATTYTYDAFNLIALTDAEGNTTTYEYDGAGRKIAEQLGRERTEYAYDALGRLNRTKKGDLVHISEHNSLDQVTEERQEDTAGELLTKVQYDYDLAGNKSLVRRFVDGKMAEELFTYDSQNRLIKYLDPLGHANLIFFNDNFQNSQGQRVIQKTEIDPLGLQTITTHDVMGHVASIEKKNQQGETLTFEEKFYDVNGNLVHYVKNHTHLTEWEYGPMDLLKRLIEGGTKVTEYNYTPTRLLEDKKKPDGTVLTNRYDSIDQLIETYSSDQTVHYTFGYNKIGQQIEATDELTQVTSWRHYDPFDRLLQEKLANGLIITSNYDDRGRKTSLELPDKSTIIYTYDALYLRTITRKGFTHYFNNFDLAGNVLSQQLVGDLGVMTFHYDLLRRKTEFVSPQGSQDVGINQVGNVRWLRTNHETQILDYDDLYHLISEKNYTYSYDKAGNRVRKNQETYDPNKLHEIVSHMTYDPNGNPRLDHDIQYTYNALDRVITITNSDFHMDLSYDTRGRLMTKSVNGRKVLLLYDDAKEIGMADLSGNILQLRVLNPTFPSERGAAVLLELNNISYYPLHDLFGNVKALFDLKGNQVESYDYSVFGEGLKSSLNPWKFASKRLCAESGLILFGHRFYDPKYGRWLTPDPAGFIDDNTNLYMFVENNPYKYLDHYGLLTGPILCLPPSMIDPEENAKISTPIIHGLGDFAIGAGNFFADVGFGLAFPYFAYKNNGDMAGIKNDWIANQNTFNSLHEDWGRLMEITVPSSSRGPMYETLRSGSEAAVEAYMIVSSIGQLCLSAATRMAISTERIVETCTRSRFTSSVTLKQSISTPTIESLENLSNLPKFKPLTRNSYRDNLKTFTGLNPSKSVHAHHVFPQELEFDFLKKGINIHDPKYLTWWEASSHQPNAKQYNLDWKAFLRKNQDATVKQILEEGKRMMTEYGIKTNY